MAESNFKIKFDPAHAAALQDPANVELLTDVGTDFGVFLRYWRFRDQERGRIIRLGENLWPGQLEFVEAVSNEKWLYALKARKLGFTTIECAYDAWCLRFRDTNARVHLFSRREAAAHDLLKAVKFGLAGMPAWMQLPMIKNSNVEFELNAGFTDMWTCPLCAEPYLDDTPVCPVHQVGTRYEQQPDTRIAVAYPADEETAVEATCTHGHVDEWARMGNPRLVWQAIEPSMAGSCHIITTGRGPANFSGEYWRMTMAGDTKFKAFFQTALQRPDRDAKWLAQKRASMDELAFRQEYAMSWQDALYGGGDFVFRGSDLDAAQEYASGFKLAEKDHRYVKAWDIGRHNDAAVCAVLDVSHDVHMVVHYLRFRGMDYPSLQAHIEQVHEAYPGPTVIEKNGPGEAVAENCNIPMSEMLLYHTSQTTKARMIAGLKVAFQNMTLRYKAKEWPQLDAELRGYQIPDTDIIQDSVMALAIAEDQGPKAFIRGKAGKIQTW